MKQSFMKKLFILALFFVFVSPLISDAQKSLKLTKVKSGKEFILPEGTRVAYVLDSGFISGVGILQKVYNDSLVVDETTISMEDLKLFGRKKRGSGFGSFLLGALGGSMVGTAFSPASEPDFTCTNCSVTVVENKTDPSVYVVLVGGGLAIAAVGLHVALVNSPKNIR